MRGMGGEGGSREEGGDLGRGSSGGGMRGLWEFARYRGCRIVAWQLSRTCGSNVPRLLDAE